MKASLGVAFRVFVAKGGLAPHKLSRWLLMLILSEVSRRFKFSFFIYHNTKLPDFLLINYLHSMKTKQAKRSSKSSVREEIVRSAIASFRIEGIYISEKQASATLKKVEASLGKLN